LLKQVFRQPLPKLNAASGILSFPVNQRAATHPDPHRILEALEELLWQWKGQLAREWFPYLFGLKGDLLIASGDMENERIFKTQTNALASVLTKQRSPALSADGSGS